MPGWTLWITPDPPGVAKLNASPAGCTAMADRVQSSMVASPPSSEVGATASRNVGSGRTVTLAEAFAVAVDPSLSTTVTVAVFAISPGLDCCTV